MKPYDCGACHTTGWVADTDADTDGTLADNQDGLPGIHGTWAAPGIHCEACHGPGANGPDGNQSHGWPATASLSNRIEVTGVIQLPTDGATDPTGGLAMRYGVNDSIDLSLGLASDAGADASLSAFIDFRF